MVADGLDDGTGEDVGVGEDVAITAELDTDGPVVRSQLISYRLTTLAGFGVRICASVKSIVP